MAMLIDSYDRLRPRLRLYVSACFYYSGLVPLARWWAQRSQPHLTILYYHQASKANLRSHWQYVRRHYRVLPLETALAELRMPPEKAVQRRDQRPLLALTFDDGYYDHYTHAFPLACKLQLPMTIFLIPGHMESGKSFWWANRLIRHARAEQMTFEEHTYHLGDLEECKALAQAVKRAGYDWAVTVKPGVNTCQSDPHLLTRRHMDAAKHWLVMAAETAGIWGFFSQLKSVMRKYL